ncbi:phosphonate ABC transporter, permease protein PhnE [Novosphingobium mangrovi (ex Huang et al. 2023)]|uniref:Phosphonate ABC transporter, permease protein PhnE n=1 Tax=Novosphingobium mangrovi (ex Huang et al. 2023) TaxID=2976432 RepID=A0ABT2I9H8_9SPHN|nr:phosphonate ABC transporter, permease protein PhnE [Novosphingobium mangrovi (ex Huang et al. 2023)]MCT2401474.1 phosphonate ABC transporter, permease protein PhnE [Novosphingobium mangrovi (ex Huang et al. 2023)]
MKAAVPAVDPAGWAYPQPFGWRSLFVVIAAFAVLFYTGGRVEAGRMLSLTGAALMGDKAAEGGQGNVLARLFPLQVSERQDIARIANFDPAYLPLFAHLEEVRTSEQALDPETLEMKTRTVTRTYLVKPFGYLRHVAIKVLETLEIALWGTVIGVLVGLPLALLGASNVTPYGGVRFLARSVVSFLRAMPELISALFLVIAYGFGPIAGFMALGLHAAGVLGKFYADDMENADRRPQEALAAIGAGRIAIWRLAIVPQVMPQYIGATLYVLDRNVRMATVIGLVGAGGIGQELKGRYDMYEYGHVGTILIAIFLVVLALDQISAHLRRRFL